jgi:hypothetical protein
VQAGSHCTKTLCYSDSRGNGIFMHRHFYEIAKELACSDLTFPAVVFLAARLLSVNNSDPSVCLFIRFCNQRISANAVGRYMLA